MTQLDTQPTHSDLLGTAYANDRAHVFHSWSAQATLNPTVIAGGKGSRIWDDQGNEWIDFTSQLINVNIGHQHPKMIEAIKAQAEQLCTVSPGAANDVRSEAARLIAERAPGNLDHVFFTNGGAEAIENTIRMAKGHTGRMKILSMYRSYHGSTTGAISLTGEGRRLDNEPGMPGAVKFWGPFLYRSAFHSADEQQEAERGLQHLRDVITFEGTDKVAAIVLESVVGTNGILIPPDGYLAGVRALCDEFGIMMICDEVMAGFGRCGEWFAVDRWDVVPDLIAFAKGVNSGYVPLGGVVISDDIVATFQHRVYQGGLTYSGHPLACSVGGCEHQHLRENASSNTPGCWATTSSVRRYARWPNSTRVSARSAGSPRSGRSTSSPTARHAPPRAPTRSRQSSPSANRRVFGR